MLQSLIDCNHMVNVQCTLHQKVGYVNYFLSFELLPDNDIPIASSAHVC
jgi:hypothetical protein